MMRFRSIVSRFVLVLVFLCAWGYSQNRLVWKRQKYLRDWRWQLASDIKMTYNSRFFIGVGGENLFFDDFEFDDDDEEETGRCALSGSLMKTVSKKVSELGELARRGDLAGFRKLCVPQAQKTEELYRRFRRERLFWAQYNAFFARNVRDPSLMAVYVLPDGFNLNDSFEDDDIMSSPASIKRYLSAAQADKDYLMKDIRFGFRETIYLRCRGGSWLVDPDVSDPKLEKLLDIELFYPAIRNRIWDVVTMYKAGLKLDDRNFWKRKDYAKYFIPNVHFSVEEAYKIETTVIAYWDSLRRPKTDQELIMENAYDYDLSEVLKHLGSDCWKKRYTKADLERMLAIVNKRNENDVKMMVLAGQERLKAYCTKYNVRLFRKPLLIPLIGKKEELDKLNIEAYRHDVLRLLQIDLSRTYHSGKKFTNKSWKKWGLNSFQVQGYQTIRFAGKEYCIFFGIAAAIENVAQCKPDMYVAIVFLKDGMGWISPGLDRDHPEKVSMYMVILLHSAGFDYWHLLNTEFGDPNVGKSSFESFRFTAAEFNARLKKEGLYSLLRIREPEECLKYRPGMRLEEIPCLGIREILEILKKEKPATK